MKITIRVPDKVGVYKLNRIARKRVALDLISKHIKLFDKMREDVSEISLVVDGKNYKVDRKDVDSIKLKMKTDRRKLLWKGTSRYMKIDTEVSCE